MNDTSFLKYFSQLINLKRKSNLNQQQTLWCVSTIGQPQYMIPKPQHDDMVIIYLSYCWYYYL